MAPPGLKIAVFDIDGTLTDSVKAHQVAFEAALHDFNFPTLRTDWGGYKHHSDSAILAEAWHEAGRDAPADLAQLEDNYAHHYQLAVKENAFFGIPGTRSFIDHLCEQDWHLAFATGSLRSGALHKLSIIGIDGSKEVLVTASEFETREDIVSHAVELACQRTGADTPSRVLSVGDGVWDLKTATNLGYEFLGIGYAGKGAALEALGCNVYHDFYDVMTRGPNEFRTYV